MGAERFAKFMRRQDENCLKGLKRRHIELKLPSFKAPPVNDEVALQKAVKPGRYGDPQCGVAAVVKMEAVT